MSFPVLQKKYLYQVIFIVALSSILGFVMNFSLLKRYFRGEFQQSFMSPEEFPSIVFISLSEAEGLFSRGEAFFIDSRTKDLYQEGHISDSLNIPYDEVQVEISLRHFSIPRKSTLVVYCDGDECQSSVELAKILHNYGYQDIRIFFGGWREWTEAGLPVSSENDSQ